MHKHDRLCTVLSIKPESKYCNSGTEFKEKMQIFWHRIVHHFKDNESELSRFWLQIWVAECFIGYYIGSYSRKIYRMGVTLTIARREISSALVKNFLIRLQERNRSKALCLL